MGKMNKRWLAKESLAEAEIDPSRRGETLSLERIRSFK